MKLALLLLAGTAISASAQVAVESNTFGQSRSGAALDVFTIAAPGDRNPDERPALLIVAGVEPEHAIGIQVARALASRDWSASADLLATHTLYIVPCLNPDGQAWINATPAVEIGRTNTPFDADRDGRLNEDPPDDLNGDGIISMMRVFNPPEKYGLRRALIAETDEPRLSREAKPEDGETGAFTLLLEGIDNDGDGAFNEDGKGGPGSGVNLNMNFPGLFPEFSEGAGPIPVSEPETRALIDWMLQHRNITGVLVLGRGDSLLNKPQTGKYDDSGSVPDGLEKPDEPYQQHIAKLYKESVTLDAPAKPNYEGSLLSWAYADFGAWSFESAVWSRPKTEKKKDDPEAREEADQPAKPEPQQPAPGAERDALIAQGVPEMVATFITATPDERITMAAEFQNASDEERASVMAQVQALSPELQARITTAIQQTAGGGGAAPPEAAPEPERKAAKPNDSDDGKWLAYSDEARNGTGFIAWTPFDHPQLGKVEIGGFVPGFRINPPEGLSDQLAGEQAAFAITLLESLPTVEVRQPKVERMGERLWRVSVEVCNPAYLPTSTTVGLKIRQPIAVDLGVSPDQVTVGRRVLTLNRLLGSGDCERIEWLITADPGAEIPIDVRSARFANQRVTAVLEGDRP